MSFSLSWLDIRNYLIALVIFLVIDMLWLMVIAKQLYAERLGYLMAPKPNLLAALAFYVLFVVGLMVFVIHPALVNSSWLQALLAGLFFGLVTYATYDLTNLATIKDWPLLITAIDLLWGSAVSGVTALLSYWVIKLIG